MANKKKTVATKKTFTPPTVQNISKNEYEAIKKIKLRNKAIALACTFALGVGSGCGAYYGIEKAINDKATPPTVIEQVDTWQKVDFEAGKKLVGLKVNKDLLLTDWLPTTEGMTITEGKPDDMGNYYNFATINNQNIDFYVKYGLLQIGSMPITSPEKDTATYDSLNNLLASTGYCISLINGKEDPYLLTQTDADNLNRLTDIIAPIYAVADTTPTPTEQTAPVEKATESVTKPVTDKMTGNIFETNEGVTVD